MLQVSAACHGSFVSLLLQTALKLDSDLCECWVYISLTDISLDSGEIMLLFFFKENNHFFHAQADIYKKWINESPILSFNVTPQGNLQLIYY